MSNKRYVLAAQTIFKICLKYVNNKYVTFSFIQQIFQMCLLIMEEDFENSRNPYS